MSVSCSAAVLARLVLCGQCSHHRLLVLILSLQSHPVILERLSGSPERLLLVLDLLVLDGRESGTEREC